MEQMNLMDKIHQVGIVPVVVINQVEDAVPTARALLNGGICFMEITFRTACAAEAIRTVCAEVPEMIIGAGTIVSRAQAQEAVRAGAQFIVSPGFSEDVVAWCIDQQIPVVPGCVTPTEMIKAKEYGLKTVKFFPANVYGGIKAIRALSTVFRDMLFLPTGGVNADNLAEYAAESCITAIGGSWVCTGKDIAAHQFEKITDLSHEAVRVIAEART